MSVKKEEPHLIEVQAPCLASKLAAQRIGNFALIQMWMSNLSEEDIDIKDFSACLEFLEPLFEDFVFQLAKTGVFDEFTYAGAKQALERIKMEPESVSDSNRRIIIGCLYQSIEELHATLLEEFHIRFESLTVFITPEGRIAIGRYVDV